MKIGRAQSCFTKLCMTEHTFIIRVDSSSEIGIGHLSRCLVLANALAKNKAEIIFQANPEIEIVFKSDANVPFDFVAKGMASIQSLGIEKIGIITSGYDS